MATDATPQVLSDATRDVPRDSLVQVQRGAADNPEHRIADEPNVWLITAFALARALDVPPFDLFPMPDEQQAHRHTRPSHL